MSAAEKVLLQDRDSVTKLSDYINRTVSRPYKIMEVCGTHTMSISRWGIRALLPADMQLVSGPGCPVCVTDSSLMGEAVSLARTPNTVFTCFGDMLRVPVGDTTLRDLEDADVRIVLSPLDALEIAAAFPEKQVVVFAVGFDTTAPLTAATLLHAKELNIKNFTVLCAHKTMPAAINALLADGDIDALLCPGHVAAIVGAETFSFIPERLGKPAAVAGFEPVDIMLALAHIVKNLAEKSPWLINCYPRAVTARGNITALRMMAQVFEPEDAIWRGMGNIPRSGLRIREEYAEFDARYRFELSAAAVNDDPRCCCGRILRGGMTPQECPLFAGDCTPEKPCGACMVSSEGACSAAYKYERTRHNV